MLLQHQNSSNLRASVIDQLAPRPGSAWPFELDMPEERVEALELRPGLTLVLSQLSGGESCSYHHVEADDVFGIGFHLQGGATFNLGAKGFETAPLDIWAGTGPKGSASHFSLPSTGFRTASLRFSLEAAADFVGRLGHDRHSLLPLVAKASDTAATHRLQPLRAPSIALVEAMFACPYSGAARLLHLESCALSLIAAQIAADEQAPLLVSRDIQIKLVQGREYLDAHLDQPPTIVELARIIGLNDFTLKRSFKLHFGTTIFGYVRQRRMERALCDLDAGLSVGAAALAAGYECPRCFADAFRRHYGLLPSDARRRHAAP